MTSGILLASTLFLLFQPAQSGPPIETGPLRNTFVVGTETVIDNAMNLDLKADDAKFDAQLQQLKSSRNNLGTMAGEDREKDIVTATDNMIFLISACHIQAKNGVDATQCESQLKGARDRIMTAIGKHKSGPTWIDGPPS